MEDEPELAVEPEDDALAEPAQLDYARPSASLIGGTAVRRMNGLARRTRAAVAPAAGAHSA